MRTWKERGELKKSETKLRESWPVFCLRGRLSTSAISVIPRIFAIRTDRSTDIHAQTSRETWLRLLKTLEPVNAQIELAACLIGPVNFIQSSCRVAMKYSFDTHIYIMQFNSRERTNYRCIPRQGEYIFQAVWRTAKRTILKCAN